jgi:hypothetical protein
MGSCAGCDVIIRLNTFVPQSYISRDEQIVETKGVIHNTINNHRKRFLIVAWLVTGFVGSCVICLWVCGCLGVCACLCIIVCVCVCVCVCVFVFVFVCMRLRGCVFVWLFLYELLRL